MKKLIFLILIFSFKLSLAQVVPFFNAQKVGRGFFIGTEIIDQKTNLALNPKGMIFKWEIPLLTKEVKNSLANILYFVPTNLDFDNPSTINLTIEQIRNRKRYQLSSRAEIILPSVKIIKKTNGIALPLGGSVTENDILTVNTKNFYSTNFRYFWTFNNVLISNQKDVLVKDLKELKNKNGVVQVRVVGSLGEAVMDSAYLEIK